MVKIYTAGYMAGEGSDRPNWREALVQEMGVCDHITWLHPGVPPGQIPGQGDPRTYMPRDLAQINSCDICVALFDLKYARCLGAASELGILFQQRKPIIMIDKSPDIGSLDFQRSIATCVVDSIPHAADTILFVADGLC